MCAQCHAEGTSAERTHDIPETRVFERSKDGIHGAGLFKKGLIHTAVCTSCHTGHNVLRHEDPRSSIHKDNVVGTCLQCHARIEDVHAKTIAGALWEREGVVPVCVECHPPHEVRKVFYNTGIADRDCLACHTDASRAGSGSEHSVVNKTAWLQSVHSRHRVTCAQCHVGVMAVPVGDRSCKTIGGAKVDCKICHEDQVSFYEKGTHGKLHAKGDEKAPYCTDCHGVHDMIEFEAGEGDDADVIAMIRQTPTFSRNVPALCARCHREGAPAASRYFGTEANIVEHYEMSIHGKGLLDSGLTVTATCTACHTPHMELPASDPESSVHKNNIAETSGQCHDGINEKYQRSIHSEAGNPDYEARRVRGMPELPHCNDCHTAHTVARTDVSAFKLGIMDQCGKCHEDVSNSYFDTYHGKASELGDATRAKCQDCHGAHAILPSADPNSTLSHGNIVETCGKCHPGSHRQFAGYLTHATHHDKDKYPALYYTFWGMTTLLLVTFGFFGLHTLAWLPRSWKLRKEFKKTHATAHNGAMQYVRFTRFQRQLHFTMIVSFFGLAITGMMLKFSYTNWAQVLFKIFGGTDGAGLIHRVCAIATFGYFFGHLGNAFARWRKSGKKALSYFLGRESMMLGWHDVKEFKATMKWFFGRGPRPNYGRWTYWEKFDYLAVFWGVAVIGSTGMCLWFPELFTRFLPGQAINIATIIHSDEALLATGFIFTIHFFNTHFRPEKFPMDPVIFTGRMTIEELKLERPRLYEELKESDKLDENLKEPIALGWRRWAKIFGFTALTVGFLLVALIIYAMVFAYR
jgi:cytochrome b subunit of formate dehydrogenase